MSTVTPYIHKTPPMKKLLNETLRYSAGVALLITAIPLVVTLAASCAVGYSWYLIRSRHPDEEHWVSLTRD